MKPEDNWQKVAEQFRDNQAPPSNDSPPPGFATRVVALADLEPKASLMIRFRNWSLGTAAATALALVIVLSLHEPETQFVPVPQLNLPTPAKP
jgi:hypothetical protein